MNAKMLTDLYTETVKSYSRQPNEEEFKSWKDVLGDSSYSDVDGALRRWHSNTTIDDFTGRPFGARMPSPADLRVSIQSFNRAELERFSPCNQNGCDGGWVKVGTPKLDEKIDHRAVRRCQCFYDWAARIKVA